MFIALNLVASAKEASIKHRSTAGSYGLAVTSALELLPEMTSRKTPPGLYLLLNHWINSVLLSRPQDESSNQEKFASLGLLDHKKVIFVVVSGRRNQKAEINLKWNKAW